MDRFEGYPEAENIQLKIYSEKDMRMTVGFVLLVMVAFLGLMCYGSESVVKLGLIEIMITRGIAILFLLIALSVYITFCRELVMCKDGCLVKFWRIHRFYKWKDLKVKRYEKYKNMYDDSMRNVQLGYEDGIFFSFKQAKKPKWMMARTYCYLRRPWSSFFVNFYPGGIDVDLEELQSDEGVIDWTMYLEKTKKKPTLKQVCWESQREPENYPVDKELFFYYMDLWGVEIEDYNREKD